MTATAILDLERAGFTREQVEALARWHEAGIDLSHLATKADLADVRTELAELRAAFDRTREIEVELRGELADARTRAAVAEAKLEAERSGSQALIIELRQQIEDARRPWWRRLAG